MDTLYCRREDGLQIMARNKSTTIPTEHSLWVRPMRPLLDDGSPVGPVVMVTVKLGDAGSFPFCAITLTRNCRLVAWPILPSAAGAWNIDHVTLELPSRRMHCTYFKSNGQRDAISDHWKAHEISHANVDLWFNFIIRKSVIERQDLVIERWMKSPTPQDAERRKAEFVRFAQNIRHTEVNVPSNADGGDYFIGAFLFHKDPTKPPDIVPELLLAGNVNTEIEGWPDGTFAVAVTGVRVEASNLLVAMANPPGRANTDVVIGFPRSRR
jgi:hypothetical protein